MRNTMLACGAASFAATEAMPFPGGSGAHGRLSLREPPSLEKEPRAISTLRLHSEVV